MSVIAIEVPVLFVNPHRTEPSVLKDNRQHFPLTEFCVKSERFAKIDEGIERAPLLKSSKHSCKYGFVGFLDRTCSSRLLSDSNNGGRRMPDVEVRASPKSRM